MKILHYLVHTIAYYIAWFFCLTLAAHGDAWLSTFIVLTCVLLQLLWQHYTKNDLQGLWSLLALVVLFSTLVDSMLISTGVVIYAANPFSPYATSPWMISMWISFSVILYALLRGYFTRYVFLGLISFFGFALAFNVGRALGAAVFPYGNYITCIFIGSIWAFLLPLCLFCYQKIGGKH